MADSPKFRDLREQDTDPYLTKSGDELEAEAAATREAAGPVKTLNPNPVGEDGYVGVDPVYQNYANEQMKPGTPEADESAVAAVEVAYVESYELNEDDSKVVTDPGLGGKTTEVGDPGGQTFRTILPGQEGYDLAKAEEQNGPPLRVYNDEELKAGESSSEDDTETEDAPAQVPGFNLGGTTEQPNTGADTSDQSGTRSGD